MSLVALCLGAAAPSAAAAAPFSFLVESTDQLGVPGHPAGTELTPEGYLYTGEGELTFRFGPRMRAWDQPIRTLAAGRYPVISSSDAAAGVRYTLTVFAAEVDGQPVDLVRVQMRNLGARRARAQWGAAWRHTGGEVKAGGARRFRFQRPATPARPGLYSQPGSGFSAEARYGFSGRTLTRDGRALYVGPRARRGVRLSRRVGNGKLTPTTPRGRTNATVTLRPGGSAHLDYAVPVTAPAAGSPQHQAAAGASFDAERERTLDFWRRLLRPAIELNLPEEKVEDAFYASLVNAAMPRHTDGGRWIQNVNLLQYHAFWLRDAAAMTQAFDLAGLHRIAGENLPFYLDWQQADGLFLSRPGQLDGFGQALWSIGEHVRRSGDLPLGNSLLPAVERAMGWFDAARASDPLGLVPPSDPRDNELVAGHLAGDQFWAVAGVERAVGLASSLGRPDLAARWQASLDEFRAALARALTAAESRTAGAIPPSLDNPGGRDWGNLWASYPARVVPPDDPAVTATLKRARDGFAEGIATYGRNLHHYLGFRVWQTELLRGEQEGVVRGLYDTLAHTTATHGGFESGVRVYGSRATDDNMAPHGWFAAEYVALLRNMLVREAGKGIVLMSALSPAWLGPGKHLSVARAPTLFGDVAFTLHAGRRGAELSWRADVPDGTPIVWPLPEGARDVEAAGLDAKSRTITLPGRRGRMSVRWRFEGGSADYESAVRRLMSAYERRAG